MKDLCTGFSHVADVIGTIEGVIEYSHWYLSSAVRLGVYWVSKNSGGFVQRNFGTKLVPECM